MELKNRYSVHKNISWNSNKHLSTSQNSKTNNEISNSNKEISKTNIFTNEIKSDKYHNNNKPLTDKFEIKFINSMFMLVTIFAMREPLISLINLIPVNSYILFVILNMYLASYIFLNQLNSKRNEIESIHPSESIRNISLIIASNGIVFGTILIVRKIWLILLDELKNLPSGKNIDLQSVDTVNEFLINSFPIIEITTLISSVLLIRVFGSKWLINRNIWKYLFTQIVLVLLSKTLFFLISLI